MQIKQMREKLGYTQKELAEKLGVTVGAVRHWEQGLRNPSNTTLQLIKTYRGKKKNSKKHQSSS